MRMRDSTRLKLHIAAGAAIGAGLLSLFGAIGSAVTTDWDAAIRRLSSGLLLISAGVTMIRIVG